MPLNLSIKLGIRVLRSSAHYVLDEIPDSDSLVLYKIVCFFWGLGMFYSVFPKLCPPVYSKFWNTFGRRTANHSSRPRIGKQNS